MAMPATSGSLVQALEMSFNADILDEAFVFLLCFRWLGS